MVAFLFPVDIVTATYGVMEVTRRFNRYFINNNNNKKKKINIITIININIDNNNNNNHNSNEDLDQLLITEPQYRFWNSMHVVISEIITFCVITLCVRKVITICVERLLHFALKILLHFASMLLHFALVLHFAAILITFCVNITFCGVTIPFIPWSSNVIACWWGGPRVPFWQSHGCYGLVLQKMKQKFHRGDQAPSP